MTTSQGQEEDGVLASSCIKDLRSPSSPDIMYTSVLVSSVLLTLLVKSSLQNPHEDGGRGTRAYPGGGPGYGYGYGYGGQGYGEGAGFGGSKGYYGGSPGFGGSKGYYGGYGGFRGGQGYGGSQGDDSRYGFNIVDTPQMYGYEANYPGGTTSFYLLGPVGPGQQKGLQGYGQPGGYDKTWNAGNFQGYNKGQGWNSPSVQGYNKGQQWNSQGWNNNQGPGQHWDTQHG